MKYKAEEIYIDAQTPEQRLCRATICRALLDVFSANEQATQKEVDDAYRWLMSNDNHIGSFNQCCEACNLEPEPMRDWIVRALENGHIETHGRARMFLN